MSEPTNAISEPQLGQLCVQVHQRRAPELELGPLRTAAETLAKSTPGIRGIGFTEGEDDGTYLNIVFAAEDPAEAWHHVEAALLGSPQFGAALRTSSIAMCTGTDGWNDYMLLYHYDPQVAQDSPGEA